MIIDSHAHVVAPPELFAYRSALLASRGHHGKGSPGINDERLAEFVGRNVDIMDSVGTDVQFISPRPFQQMHSEKPASIVSWWTEATNEIIQREVAVRPDRLVGVGGIPQIAGEPVSVVFEELERCATERGFVGVLLDPDPFEGTEYVPPLGDEYWYPLYEKLVQLDMPALVHSASCKNLRESYSGHFITEESIAVPSLIEHDVPGKFPGLRLVISHGGGSVPYQIGRWRASRINRSGSGGRSAAGGALAARARRSTRVSGSSTSTPSSTTRSRWSCCSRSSGRTGACSAPRSPAQAPPRTPETGQSLDDLKPVIESIDFLTSDDLKGIFEDNTLRVYSKFKPAVAAG